MSASTPDDSNDEDFHPRTFLAWSNKKTIPRFVPGNEFNICGPLHHGVLGTVLECVHSRLNSMKKG